MDSNQVCKTYKMCLIQNNLGMDLCTMSNYFHHNNNLVHKFHKMNHFYSLSMMEYNLNKYFNLFYNTQSNTMNKYFHYLNN